MPTTVEELGRSGNTQGRKRSYKVWDAATESAALLSVASLISTTLDGFPLTSLDYDETDVVNCYEVTATWGVGNQNQQEQPETNSFSVQFDFAAVPTKVVLPINPIKVYTSSGEEADHGFQLIGDKGRKDEEPEGVEVFEPFLTFSETWYKPSNFVDESYINLMRTLIGRTNNATWRGFEAGELMAMGVSGSKRGFKGDWELQYKFASRENQTDLEISGITIPSKKGWDFLWPIVELKHESAGSLKAAKRKIKAIAVTTPFRSANYSSFGIDPA